jgi:zinc protease
MKKLILLAASSLLFSWASFAQNTTKLDRSIRPKPGPAPSVNIGNAESFTASNGMKVFVVQNNKLPIVSYSLDLDIQQALEGDKAGMSGMIGELLTAGTQVRSKDEFNKELDMLGAQFNVGAEGFFMQSLKKNSDKLLALASELILKPKFSQEELDKLKKQSISGLESNKDDPEAMSRNISSILNFGSGHIFGEVPNKNTINNITLEACQKYFETYYKPNVAYMAVVGNITLAEAKAQVEKYFGAWQKGNVPVATYPTPKANVANVAIVNKSDAVQTVVDITYPIDLKPGSPDDIKARVANGILGGGSTGRLFQNLREKHAWTYGSYSSINTNKMTNCATFSATANCTTNATDSSVAEILNEMKKMRTQKVTKEELEGYKNYMAGTFALGLESPQTLARYAINIEKNKMPKDFYKNYLKNVEAVTAEDVLEVSKKYINPSIANITVAGDRATIADKLKKFGPVTEYDMFGGVVVNKPAKAIDANMTAENVIANYIKATGGEDKWRAVKDITITMSTTMQGMGINITTAKKAPGKYFLDVNANGMSFQKIKFNGTKGVQEAMGQKTDLEGEELAKMKEEAQIFEEVDYIKNGYKLMLKGTEKVEGVDAYAVKVTSPSGNESTHYFDMNTFLKIKSVGAGEGGVTQTSYLSDYKEVNGLKYPHTIKQSFGPQNMDMKTEKIEINKGLADDMFE